MKNFRTLKEPNLSYNDSPVAMRSLPTFSLDEQQLPEIKGWQVGKKYRLEIEVELVSLGKNEYATKEPLDASFKIKKIRDLTPSDEELRAKKGYA